MQNLLPLNKRRLQQRAQVETPDSVYWGRLAKPELLKEHNTIDYLDFSPSDPDNFAVTCSERVQIYNLVTKLLIRNLSRFQKTAYGATFRQDGLFLAAGDEEGYVKLFDSTRNIMRLFKGHTAPVHRTFFTADKLQLASFGDDKSVRLRDLANGKVVQTYEDTHTDYVRAGAMHQQAGHIFVSGGYDGKINLYDTRAKTAVQRTVDHGAPVESMLFLPNGSIFVSAGGSQVRLWDLINGCRLFTMMSQHHKTVTCLRLGSDGRRLLSGGLDGQVKIYDMSTYRTVHTLTYPNAVVSLAVADGDKAVVAGMVDGQVSIRRMMADSKPSDLEKIREDLARNNFTSRKRTNNTQEGDPIIKDRVQEPELISYDVHFRPFNCKEALDEVMHEQKMENHPELVVAVITDLLHRGSLGKALMGRREAELVRFIDFICKHLGEMRFLRRLMMAASRVLDVLEQHFVGYSEKLIEALQRLSLAMLEEVRLTADLMRLKGVLHIMHAVYIR
ncbi:U3 small nucleolar RNA-associated protein 15 homolog [Drosophila sechellia]|uniref:U3 small nucleolar RNA-associated protein 15 homolog n=1 Tax=Drosophila sechellia TaxID=7238 RepID=UPI0013DDDD91|nr:U3 small nucleolar RNA-associated protein 15 homolog [Drosophila sechellia]